MWALRALGRLARPGTTYHTLPDASEGQRGSTTGKLAGKLVENCGDYYIGLAPPPPLGRFGVINVNSAGDHVRPVEVQSVKIEPAHVAAVAGVIARLSKLKVVPTIERAYRADVDGNGKPEVILQATHPDLNGDPADYKRHYYSLIVVLPDVPGAEPAFTGYLQAVKDMASFEVVALDSVADVDLDGSAELLVRARHNEGWQTQVFAYDGKLHELFHSVGGERECPSSN